MKTLKNNFYNLCINCALLLFIIIIIIIIGTNKCVCIYIYIKTLNYITDAPKCFGASTPSSGNFDFLC